MNIFEKVNAKVWLGAAGAIVSVVGAVISNKQDLIKKQELTKDAAEAAAKIVMDKLSNNEG